MKRIVWLVLALFCAALGQVQAVDTLHAKAKPCHCCHAGCCDTTGCCPPASSSFQGFETALSAEVSRQPAAEETRLGKERVHGFYFSIVALAEPSRQRTAPAAPRVLTATVPLFAAHCSFLI